MKLQILTPDKAVFDGDVDEIRVPGASGPFEILKDHAPILSSLVPGELRVKIGHKETFYTITGGFLEFHKNQAVILAEAAETPAEIDMKRVEAAKQRALDIISNPAEAALEKAQAKLALARAEVRKKLAEKPRS
jgi:F-type H+-transporting ATPase subunit epsilon